MLQDANTDATPAVERASGKARKREPPPRVPHIYGAAPGVCFRWPLTGEWSRRHVTVTEACGRKLLEIVLVGAAFRENWEHLQ